MSARQPNILLLLSDQHRGSALSCAGDPNIKTTHLDRLASEGMRFINAYSNAPMCSPARACLYTGQHISTHGVNCLFTPLLPRQPVLPEVLRAAGYHTSHMGKWHLSGGDCPSHFVSPYFRPGWDEWMGWENSNCPFKTEYSTGSMPVPLLTMDGYQTDVITDMTVKWLRARDHKSPWFHAMSFEPPHPPNIAPQRYMDLFFDREIFLRDNVPLDDRNRPELIERLRGYYAQIANMDDNIGRVLAALDETGQRETTLVIYCSDHGDMLGSHGRGNKEVPEEESANIPLIVRHPGRIPAGMTNAALIGLVDLMPTLLGYAGIEIPTAVEGVDLSGKLTGAGGRSRDHVLIQFDRAFFDHNENHNLHTRTIRMGEWKYTVHYHIALCRMYNLADDPYEMKNLLSRPDLAGLRETLHRRLAEELSVIGDDFLNQLPRDDDRPPPAEAW